MSLPAKRTTSRPPRKKEIKQQGGFYKAGNKQVPDAMRTQEDANEKNIPVEIIRTEQTDEYAEAIVRAWLPDKSQYVDDAVHHQFSVIRELKALEYLEKQVSGNSVYFRGSPIQMFEDLSQPFNKNGDPILTGVGYLKLLTEMARFKNFALRDAITKATRRAQLKILNREWRDKEEIQAEKSEEKMVKESIEEQKQERAQRRTKRTVTKKEAPKESEKVVDAEVTQEVNPDTVFTDCKNGLIICDMLRNQKKPLTRDNINKKMVSMMPDKYTADDVKELNNCMDKAGIE